MSSKRSVSPNPWETLAASDNPRARHTVAAMPELNPWIAALDDCSEPLSKNPFAVQDGASSYPHPHISPKKATRVYHQRPPKRQKVTISKGRSEGHLETHHALGGVPLGGAGLGLSSGGASMVEINGGEIVPNMMVEGQESCDIGHSDNFSLPAADIQPLAFATATFSEAQITSYVEAIEASGAGISWIGGHIYVVEGWDVSRERSTVRSFCSV